MFEVSVPGVLIISQIIREVIQLGTVFFGWLAILSVCLKFVSHFGHVPLLPSCIVESNYELMTREPRKKCKKAFYDVFLLYHI